MTARPTRNWESSEDPPPGRGSRNPYSGLFEGPNAAPRVAAVRRALNRALDEWWRLGQMPPKGLVRDGLLVLEAGHPLEEAERSLLLRAAFFYGQGMATALSHQTDPERIAAVLLDMLLSAQRPLPPPQVRAAAKKDADSQRWLPLLLGQLQEEANQPLEPRRTLAQAALLYLQEDRRAPDPWTPISAAAASPAASPASPKAPRRRRRRLSARGARRIASVLTTLALLIIALGLLFFWREVQLQANRGGPVAVIPSGVYLISQAPGSLESRLVGLESFAIDRTEVTNRAYRACYDAGVCTWPTRTTSVMRPDYFLAPAYDNFPMANVTWAQAAAFCGWLGKRLPLEEEWEVAAGSALTVQERFIFPWGDFFEPAFANSVVAAIGDTTAVGTFSPAGDSPAGLADAAGNVAEWTATPADPLLSPPTAYAVKGGAFLDEPFDLSVDSRALLPPDASHPWLGFRCAVTLPTEAATQIHLPSIFAQ